MIFGLPKLYGYLGIALAAVLAVGVVYGKGKSVGRAEIQVVLDEERAVHKTEFDKQVAETARVQAAWDSTKEREREINARLEVVTADSTTLAERLRQHTRRRVCPVSGPASSAASPDGTSGVTGSDESIERRTGEVFAACARDSERLTQFQAFYESLRAAQ